MKRFRIPFALLLLSLLSILLVGCGSMENFLYTREVTTKPGQILGTNVVYVTNAVVTPALTDSGTGQVIVAAKTNAVVTPQFTIQYAPPTYVTNLVPRPTIDGGLEVVGALPIPFAGTGALIAGWLVHAYAGFRNKRKSEAVAEALITGIEKSRVFLQSTPEGQRIDGVIRQHLIDSQVSNGVYREVKTLVDRYTDATTRPATPTAPAAPATAA